MIKFSQQKRQKLFMNQKQEQCSSRSYKKTEKDTGKGKERDSPAFLKTAIASDYKKTISSRAK